MRIYYNKHSRKPGHDDVDFARRTLALYRKQGIANKNMGLRLLMAARPRRAAAGPDCRQTAAATGRSEDSAPCFAPTDAAGDGEIHQERCDLPIDSVVWEREYGDEMDEEQGTEHTKEGDAAMARATLRRIGREERLLERAEGRLWLQVLPMLCLLVFGALWFVPIIRPALLVVWFLAPILLIQIALWSNGRRIDAILDMMRTRRDG